MFKTSIINGKHINVMDDADAIALCNSLVDTLKDLRVEQGFTQQMIAEAAGVNFSTISRIESHERIPRLDIILRYANAVNAMIDVVPTQPSDAINWSFTCK